MRIERLVAMANDIGAFFAAEPDKAEAAKNVATHLKRFWDPRMRREIVAHYLSTAERVCTISPAPPWRRWRQEQTIYKASGPGDARVRA